MTKPPSIREDAYTLIAALERRISALESSGLGNKGIIDGSIDFYDIGRTLRYRVGKRSDATFGIEDFSGEPGPLRLIPVYVRSGLASDQTISSTTNFTTLTLADSSYFGPLNFPSVGPRSTWEIEMPMICNITLQLRWITFGTGIRSASIELTRSTGEVVPVSFDQPGVTSGSQIASGYMHRATASPFLLPGDVLRCKVRQNSGSSIDLARETRDDVAGGTFFELSGFMMPDIESTD